MNCVFCFLRSIDGIWQCNIHWTFVFQAACRYSGESTDTPWYVFLIAVGNSSDKFQILGYIFGFLEEAILLGAIASVKSIFSRPFNSGPEVCL